jgi:hypothetical protein
VSGGRLRVMVVEVIKPADRSGAVTDHYGPRRPGLAGALAAAAPAGLLALGGLIGTVSIVPQLGWSRALSVPLLCAAGPAAVWTARRIIASRRVRTTVPAALLARRYHGSLAGVTDSERRPLRPIGTTAYDVAVRTGALLAELVAIPSVRIFHGVRPVGAALPVTPHVLCAGRRLLLIESVAWPPGRYETTPSGRVLCDGIYIGQSVRALLAAVRHWRATLSKAHRVSAMVVVHPAADGALALPAGVPGDLTWVLADEAIHDLRRRIAGGRGRQAVRRNTVAALLAATADAA